jgi:hypothetical protein
MFPLPLGRGRKIGLGLEKRKPDFTGEGFIIAEG